MVGDAPQERTIAVRYKNERTRREELVPVAYFEQGEGKKPVIFIHGLGGSARDGLLLFQHMRGRRISISLPGFGHTPALTVDQNGISAYREMVRLVMDALGIEKAYFYGMSMGGATALAFGAKYPERAHAVIAQGAPFYGRNFPAWLLGFTHVLAQWGKQRSLFFWWLGLDTFGWCEGKLKESVRTHPDLVRSVFRGLMTPEEEMLATPEVKMIGVADFLEADARAAVEAGESIFRMDLRDALRNYTVPVLVCDGERPRSQALRTTQDIMELLPRGLAKCYLFPQVGHMATMLCSQEAAAVASSFFRESQKMRPAQ